MINFLTLDLTNYSCDADVLPMFDAALFVIRIIQIAVPFVLVIWGSLDFFKALIAGDEKEMKMKRKPFISRVVSALIILVLPWIVKLIAKQIAGNESASNFWKCYDQATPKIDFSRWNGGGSSGGSSGGSGGSTSTEKKNCTQFGANKGSVCPKVDDYGAACEITAPKGESKPGCGYKANAKTCEDYGVDIASGACPSKDDYNKSCKWETKNGSTGNCVTK